jgi:FtsZ-binding cell division protein ZapB
MEQDIPILRPLSSMVDAGTIPHEPAIQVTTVPQYPVMTNTIVTQEPIVQVDTVTPKPAAPQRIVPLELVIQEPIVHVEIVPQEPVLTDTVVTQEPTTQPDEDVPLAQLFAQIERKIKNTENSRIDALITEYDNLKEELNTLKQEVEAARQKNPEGITSDILALTKAVMDRNKELMFFECGNIYFEAGYEVVKVLVTKGPTTISVKTEHDLTATQKSVKQRRSQHHKTVVGIPEACKPEPLFPSRVVTRATQTDSVLKDKETHTDC